MSDHRARRKFRSGIDEGCIAAGRTTTDPDDPGRVRIDFDLDLRVIECSPTLDKEPEDKSERAQYRDSTHRTTLESCLG